MLHITDVQINPQTAAVIAHMPPVLVSLVNAVITAEPGQSGRAWEAAELVFNGHVIPHDTCNQVAVFDLNGEEHTVMRIGGKWQCDCGQPQCLHDLAAAFAIEEPAGLVTGQQNDNVGAGSLGL